jgi:LysM repeat protein
MYRFFRLLRLLLILILVGGVVGGVALFVITGSRQSQMAVYGRIVTAAVETAVAHALFDATRTAESPLSHFRLVVLLPDESLASLAERYDTTLEVIRMANGLPDTVERAVGGERIVVPQGVQVLQPPRRLRIHTAQVGDTLEELAQSYGVSLSLLEADNPVLTTRSLMPGDIVFIAQLL